PSKARPEVRVKIPEDREIVLLIHRVIERVVIHGPMFEALLMDKEGRNPKYVFLFQNDSPEHIYYRWRLYSVLNGDDLKKWPTEPFSMFDEGPIWVPPEIPFDDNMVDLEEDSDSSVDSDDSAAVARRTARTTASSVPKGTLSHIHRLKLEAKIRSATLTRVSIATAMLFCLDHADAADEIAETLARSLTLPATPIFPTKIARLYLLSDVLHNSGAPNVPNAWRFRNAVERHLPTVFRHLGVVWGGIGARLRAEQMRRLVFAVVSVWERWMVFSTDFTQGLRDVFMEGRERAEEEGRAKEGRERFQKSLMEQRDAKVGVYAMEEDEEDVDGVPMEEDVDGEPMDVDRPKKGGWVSIDAEKDGEREEESPAEVKPRGGFAPIGFSEPQAAPAASQQPAAGSGVALGGFTPISLTGPGQRMGQVLPKERSVAKPVNPAPRVKGVIRPPLVQATQQQQLAPGQPVQQRPLRPPPPPPRRNGAPPARVEAPPGSGAPVRPAGAVGQPVARPAVHAASKPPGPPPGRPPKKTSPAKGKAEDDEEDDMFA
ncbi:U2 snRNP-associated SURP domain-containing protein, partial [Irineochytrium annulatum]